jgi:uncharacterized protein (DUF427 family)
MAQSPGYREDPAHEVVETHLDQHVKVEVNGELIADSCDVVKVDEDGYPSRYYFPRRDVDMSKLSRSDTTTHCPFKGTAHYYGLQASRFKFVDAVWTYEDPYEEHLALAGRLAFYDEKSPEIVITLG